MSLARGEGPFQGAIGARPVEAPAMVIAVAATPEERLRVTQLVGEDLALLMVATRDEAIALLLGERPPPVVEGAVVEPVPDAGHAAARRGLRPAHRQLEGRVPLSPLEHDLLRCLLAELGHTWAFDVLHRQIWGNEHLGDRADVQSVVKRLRRKLRDLGVPYASAPCAAWGCGWTGGWRRPPRSVAQRLIARFSHAEVDHHADLLVEAEGPVRVSVESRTVQPWPRAAANASTSRHWARPRPRWSFRVASRATNPVSSSSTWTRWSRDGARGVDRRRGGSTARTRVASRFAPHSS